MAISKLNIVNVSIDVIIPSYRLNEINLLPIFQWKIPLFSSVRYFLIVDNPEASIPSSILQLAEGGMVRLLINEKNRGASFARNRGIDAGEGDWILLLDDDLEFPENLLTIYAMAAINFPDETGFIGLIKLPESVTDFSKAILASSSMDIFSIAERCSCYPWGATANIMLRRSALRGIRFSLLYPKSGGGEDIDLFLKVRETNGERNLKALPQAIVMHPWWNHGKPEYKKSFRYGLGNSYLAELNPAYAYYDFLNTPETVFILLLLSVILLILKPSWIKPVLTIMVMVLAIEIVASFAQTLKRNHKANIFVLTYVLAMRLIYETGLLWGSLSRFRLTGIGERFHDDGKRNKLFFYRTNTHKTIKWILYPLLAFFIYRNFF